MQCLELPHRKIACALPLRAGGLGLTDLFGIACKLRSINLASTAVSWSVAAAEARLWHKSQL
jgi:hypothetical protein